ncbi:hypothetical protein [Telmatospirillum sp.]|uniref:hypothetical protein n=1 Tax=Telmatospirillum sp. TaxID=2079197 RepID=UPI00284EED4C|nr:hypothetical protein [Telmatospirillum sp.]MDR3436471.1 hypothetical protein [Telmatospirillum sp.]
MDKTSLTKAVQEAIRFLNAAQAVNEELGDHPNYVVGTRRSGALRRSSLDLTRALADLRKPS